MKYAITIWIVLWIITSILKEHCQYICTVFTFVVSSVYIWYPFAILYCMLSVPVWHRHNLSLTRIKLPFFICLNLVWIMSFKYVSVINSCAGEVCLLLLDFGFWFRCFGALQKIEAMAFQLKHNGKHAVFSKGRSSESLLVCCIGYLVNGGPPLLCIYYFIG